MSNQNKIQQCLVLIKPDGLVKSLTGNIISMLSETKLKIVGSKVVSVNRELAEKHYSELRDKLMKKFGDEKGATVFEEVLKYIQGHYHTNRIMALVYHGEDAIQKIREIAGETNPEDATPITIRGKYGRIHSKTGVFENVIHASDTEENAKKEIQLWFSPEELAERIYEIKAEKVQQEKLVWE